MKMIICLAALIAVALAAPPRVDESNVATVLRYDNNNDGIGEFNYGYVVNYFFFKFISRCFNNINQFICGSIDLTQVMVFHETNKENQWMLVPMMNQSKSAVHTVTLDPIMFYTQLHTPLVDQVSYHLVVTSQQHNCKIMKSINDRLCTVYIKHPNGTKFFQFIKRLRLG